MSLLSTILGKIIPSSKATTTDAAAGGASSTSSTDTAGTPGDAAPAESETAAAGDK